MNVAAISGFWGKKILKVDSNYGTRDCLHNHFREDGIFSCYAIKKCTWHK